MSRTNIVLDTKLVKEAMVYSDCKTKKELVNTALSEFVKMLKRKGIVKFMGSHCWEGDLTKTRRSRFKNPERFIKLV